MSHDCLQLLMIVLVGRAYTTAALAVWPSAATPLAGAGGLGHQLGRLASIARAGSPTDEVRGPLRMSAVSLALFTATEWAPMLLIAVV